MICTYYITVQRKVNRQNVNVCIKFVYAYEQYFANRDYPNSDLVDRSDEQLYADKLRHQKAFMMLKRKASGLDGRGSSGISLLPQS